jgi:hypothetical protein
MGGLGNSPFRTDADGDEGPSPDADEPFIFGDPLADGEDVEWL